MPKSLAKLMLLCATLPLAGCSTLPQLPPLTALASKTLAGAPTVHNSGVKRSDGSWDVPCPTQREIAELNTYLGSATATLADGTSYAAPCEMSPAKVKPKLAPAAKTVPAPPTKTS